MPLPLLPASASFAGLMHRIAGQLRLATPLYFTSGEGVGIHVQPGTGKVHLCETTLARVSPRTLEVVAAHEAGHILESERLWRFLVARRSMGLALVALVVATLGHVHTGQLIVAASLLAVGRERKVPRQLADARTEGFADAVACRYACTSHEWLVAVQDYARALETPGDACLRYRQHMAVELERVNGLDRVLRWGPDVLADFETAQALEQLGIRSPDVPLKENLPIAGRPNQAGMTS